MIVDIYKSLIKGGKYFFFTSLIDRIVSLLFFFVVAKTFSVEDYGQMVTIFTVTNIALIMLDFGLPIYLQREAAIDKNVDDSFTSILFIKSISLIIYLVIIFIYFTQINTKIAIVLVLLISIIALLINFISLIIYLYYGKDRIDLVFYSSLFSKALFFLLIIILKLNNATLLSFLSIFLVISIIQLLILSKKLRVIDIKLNFNIRLIDSSIKILKIAFPLGIAVLFNLLYHKVDIILISEIINSYNVGQYNVAYSFFQLTGIIFGIIWIPSFNIFAKSRTNYKENIKKLKIISVAVIIISIIMMIIIYYWSPIIIEYIFDQKYKLATSIIPILTFSILGYGLNGLTGIFLSANKEFKFLSFVAVVGLIINVLFNLLYLKKIGVVAAAYSTIITDYSILLLEIIYITLIFRKKKFYDQ